MVALNSKLYRPNKYFLSTFIPCPVNITEIMCVPRGLLTIGLECHRTDRLCRPVQIYGDPLKCVAVPLIMCVRVGLNSGIGSLFASEAVNFTSNYACSYI